MDNQDNSQAFAHDSESLQAYHYFILTLFLVVSLLTALVRVVF